MKKLNAVFVAGFPGNHIIAKPLIDYMKAYANIQYIDLPGFIGEVPALDDISFENYTRYISEKIDSLGLEEYVLCCLSMGFRIVNDMKIDKKRCIGIVALEPYTDSRCLRMNAAKKILFRSLISAFRSIRADRLVWNKSVLAYAMKMDRRPVSLADKICELDCRTFMETARLVLSDRKEVVFHDVPYVLVINRDDELVRYNVIHDLFLRKARNLKVVHQTMEHFPKNPTSEYIRKNFSEEQVHEIIRYLEENCRK